MTQARFKTRYQLVLLYALCTLPIVGYGAWQASRITHHSLLEWLPESSSERRDYEKFRDEFAYEGTVVASWPGCTVYEPKLARLAGILRRSNSFVSDAGEPYLDRVLSGPEVLADLSGEPLWLSAEQAWDRLEGTVVEQRANGS